MNFKILKTLIRKLAEAIDFMAANNIVHSDIKPDNITLQFNEDESVLEEVLLVDFGSSFEFKAEMDIKGTTPEYAAPEVLKFLNLKQKNPDKDILNIL